MSGSCESFEKHMCAESPAACVCALATKSFFTDLGQRREGEGGEGGGGGGGWGGGKGFV